MSRAAEVSGDDDHVAGLRAGPQEDPVLPYASEGRPRDREDRRFLRVPPEDGDAELAHTFLDTLRQPAEELDVRVGGHRERRDETEGSRSRGRGRKSGVQGARGE